MSQKINQFNIYIRPSNLLPSINQNSKWLEYLKIRETFSLIGVCEQKPSVYIKEKSNKTFSDGTKQTISQKVSFKVKQLKVTEENIETISESNRVDIIFEDQYSNLTIIVKNFPIKYSVKFNGDSFSVIEITGEKTTSNLNTSVLIKDRWIHPLKIIDNSIDYKGIIDNNNKLSITFNNTLADVQNLSDMRIFLNETFKGVNLLSNINESKINITLPEIEPASNNTLHIENIKDKFNQASSFKLPFKTKPPALRVVSSNLSPSMSTIPIITGEFTNNINNIEAEITQGFLNIGTEIISVSGKTVSLKPKLNLPVSKKFLIHFKVVDIYGQVFKTFGEFGTFAK